MNGPQRDAADSSQGLTATLIGNPVAEQVATVIGPYKLWEQIGEGRFGLVFVAEQQQPIRRKVALKIIKPGMVIARFETERQARRWPRTSWRSTATGSRPRQFSKPQRAGRKTRPSRHEYPIQNGTDPRDRSPRVPAAPACRRGV